MRQFDIENVDPEWFSVVKEFPEIFMEPSECVMGYYEKYGKDPKNCAVCDDESRLVNLRYGMECGIGWKEIVRGFCQEMQEFCDNLQKEGMCFQYKGCIIKEKFGRIAFQGDFSGTKGMLREFGEEYWNIIHKWEDESEKVCELTGKPGVLCKNSTGWVKTLCEEKQKELGYEPI